MKKKFVLLPGYVTSQYDGQDHYISAGQLMKLYKVRQEECVIWDPYNSYIGLTFLGPRYDGQYENMSKRIL